MKMQRCLVALALACAAFLFHADLRAGETANDSVDSPVKILCTTFPMYQITRNIVNGAEGVTVDILLPASSGCPHDYALTPRDLTRLAEADILVANGLGMENFLGARLTRANPDIMVVDSAEGMDDLLGYESIGDPVKVYVDDHGHVHDENCEHGREDAPAAEDSDADHDGKTESGHKEDAHDDEINPHLFASPLQNAELAESIARQLGELDEGRADLYRKNAAAYATAMRGLADEMKTTAATFANNRIVEPHGAFDYLARDIGLDIVTMMQPHGQELSAAQMVDLIEEIRENDAGAIVVEPQYPARTGEMLSRETGLPVVMLDPVASGPDDAPLNYYETIMRENIKTLAKTLGRK